MDLQEIRNDLTELGLADNLNLALLVYLAATARKTNRKISIVFAGPAGLGKSHLVKTVLKLFPEEDIITSSKMTPVALLKQGDLSNKILHIYEKFTDPQFAQYIRELISEGEVVYATADRQYRLQGPTTLIETTVDSESIGMENKTRCFVANIDTSSEAKENILEKQKILRTIEGLSLQNKTERIKANHKKFQKELDPSLRIVIPFAKNIRFVAKSYHAPRIMERILNAISTIAYINQRERTICEKDNVKYIEAVAEDFENARSLLVNLPIIEEEFLFPKDTADFFEVFRGHKQALSRDRYFTRGDVMNCLGKRHPYGSYKVAAKHLRFLSQEGFIEELAIRGRKNCVRYSFTERFPKEPVNLSENCYATLCLL